MVTYGTRPELIKLAPVVFALREQPETFNVVVCSTGQHREMLDQVQTVFGIAPDIDLGVMAPNQQLNSLSANVMASVDRVLRQVEPDWVLVQGDTTTVMATALAAFHLSLKVGHVEAGLRTGNLTAPFPEEANRRITDVVSDLLFAPTARSRDVLLREGCDPERVFLTGNTVIDALHWLGGRLPEEPLVDEVLITVHRRENFGPPLRRIFMAIKTLARRFPGIQWVYPVHPNPNVLEPAHELLGKLENVRLLDPLPYDRLVSQMRRARIVLTDSGGIQEEAPTFGKPVLVLRETTERPEGVEAGLARLVGTQQDDIVNETTRLLTDESAYRQMSRLANPYGDGRASERIASILAGSRPVPFQTAAN